MVIAYGILFLHYIVVRESKSILEVLHFYNSEAKRLPADGVSPSGHDF